MNQIFRKWLEITISIHFKLVEQGGSRRTDPSKRETFQNPSDDFYSSKKMIWMFFCSKFIDKTPLFRLKRTPGINEIMDFFDCGIEIRPDQLNHLGSKKTSLTTRGVRNLETSNLKLRGLSFFSWGGDQKRPFSTVFPHPEPVFSSPPFWVFTYFHGSHVKNTRNATGCTGSTWIVPKALQWWRLQRLLNPCDSGRRCTRWSWKLLGDKVWFLQKLHLK